MFWVLFCCECGESNIMWLLIHWIDDLLLEKECYTEREAMNGSKFVGLIAFLNKLCTSLSTTNCLLVFPAFCHFGAQIVIVEQCTRNLTADFSEC